MRIANRNRTVTSVTRTIISSAIIFLPELRKGWQSCCGTKKPRSQNIRGRAPHKFACSNAPNLKEAVNQNTSTSLLNFKTSSPGCGGSIHVLCKAEI